MANYSTIYKLSKEQGVVLLTGMIFLVVLTMLVVAIMRNSTLEERMASNGRNRQLAMQAAEAVLRDAETTLFQAAPFNPFDPSGFTASCTNGFCSVPTSSTPRWNSINWTDTSVTRTFTLTTSNLTGVASQPRYFVEFIAAEGGQAPKSCPYILYRISVRGLGQDSSTFFAQNTYRHKPEKFLDGTCG